MDPKFQLKKLIKKSLTMGYTVKKQKMQRPGRSSNNIWNRLSLDFVSTSAPHIKRMGKVFQIKVFQGWVREEEFFKKSPSRKFD
jgi:hypothetical protein